jgi:endonuclease YncB( thermonuclease family)
MVILDYRLSTIDTYELHKGVPAHRALGEEARQFADDKIRGNHLRLISVMDTEKYGRTLMAIEYKTAAGNWLDLAQRLRLAGYEKPVAGAWRKRQDIDRATRIMRDLRRGT